jgi:peptidoglycan-associated lipoprotein
MVRKWMIVLVVFAFAASMLALSSCAKKQVAAGGTGAPAAGMTAPSAPAAPAAPAGKVDPLAAEIKAFESEAVYFDYDKSDLKPAARATLEKKAGWLRANAQFKLKVEGNCDERGTVEYNLALGERRAKAAVKYLNALGIAADRMTTVSYGEERPADPGHNEAAWSKNRRDEFKLSR